MLKVFTLSLIAVALMAGDITAFQKKAENQLVEIRRTDSTGYHEGDFGTAVLPGTEEEQEVVGFSKRLVPGLPTVIGLDALDEGAKGTVFVYADGKQVVNSYRGNGGLFEGIVESDVLVVLIREDGSSMVRFIEVETPTKETRAETSTAGPISLRFIVLRPGTNRYCEVVPGSGLGGRFVSASPRTLLGYRTDCKTDRVERGEQIVTLLTGNGPATSGIRTPFGTFGGARNLPSPEVRNVILDARFDNLVAFVNQGPFEAFLRVPIGSRP